MKEYCIYIKQGAAKPYILNTYNNIQSAKEKLYDIVSLEIERQRPFFVDNNFYDNRYKLVGNLKYLKIMVRDISNWEEYSEESTKNNSNNILYFMNYK